MMFPIAGDSLAVDLADSVYYAYGAVVDSVAAPGDLAAWFTAVGPRLGCVVPDVDDELHGAVLALRDAVRAVFTATTAGSVPPSTAVGILNAATKAAPAWTELEVPRNGSPSRAVRRCRNDAAQVTGVLAEDAITLVGGPALAALRACTAPGCIGFYLRTDGRQRFCSPRCAARTRAARQYERRTTSPDPAQSDRR